MGQPVFLVRNFFSRRIYPLHTLVANEEQSGNELARAANANRDPLDFWTTLTPNVEATAKVVCDRLRAADLFVLDRGHNLAGKQVVLEASDDDFASPAQTVFDLVLPSVSATGDLDDPLGVRTEEGAWLRRFPVRAAKAWRLRVPALGAGQRPQVVNMWLDLSWSPATLDTPIAPDAHELGAQEATTQTGWLVRSDVWVRRRGRLSLRLPSPFDYELARDHLQLQFGLNRPMWIVHDEEQADRAVLALPRLGTIEIEEKGAGWFYPRATFEWLEHEAKEAP